MGLPPVNRDRVTVKNTGFILCHTRNIGQIKAFNKLFEDRITKCSYEYLVFGTCVTDSNMWKADSSVALFAWHLVVRIRNKQLTAKQMKSADTRSAAARARGQSRYKHRFVFEALSVFKNLVPRLPRRVPIRTWACAVAFPVEFAAVLAELKHTADVLDSQRRGARIHVLPAFACITASLGALCLHIPLYHLNRVVF